MKKKILTFGLLIVTSTVVKAGVTLEQCLSAAYSNYPLIKQYELLSVTENIELDDINKGWLPKIGLFAQGNIQNVVPSFPQTLSNVMHQMGGDIKGLGKLQYKVGVDFNQTVWDGGVSRGQRLVTRQRSEVDRASLDVEMYGIRQRVESLYFGILLLQSQIEQTQSAIEVYESNLQRVNSLVANGVAMKSDADMIEAQLLTIRQQLNTAHTAMNGYRCSLSLFTGLDIADETLVPPSVEMPVDMSVNRPELNLFNAQMALNDSRRSITDASITPKIGLFAQAYYGYPGIDYFKAMMERDLTFNIIAGVKVSWNIDSFYTRKNALKKVDLVNQQIEAQRETFMLNNSLQTTAQLQEIRGIETVMADDKQIVELRHRVRLAAESQLRNGIIDASSLTSKINDETQAELNASYHNIQYLKAIYNLKNILNR